MKFSQFLTIIERNISWKFGVHTITPRQVINRRNPKIELNRKNQTAITFEPQVMRRRNSPVSLPLTRSRNGRNLEFVAVLLAELFQFENSTRLYLREKSFENFSKSPLGNQRSRRSFRTANGRDSKLAPRLTRVKGKTPWEFGENSFTPRRVTPNRASSGPAKSAPLGLAWTAITLEPRERSMRNSRRTLLSQRKTLAESLKQIQLPVAELFGFQVRNWEIFVPKKSL